MKREIMPHLVTVIAVIALVALGVSSATMGRNDSVEVTWDEGLTSGVTRITNDGTFKNWVQVSPDGTKLLYTEAAKAGDYWQIVYLRDANNPAKTPLVGEVSYSPAWYEDSNRFLYISYEAGTGRIVRSSVVGGGKTYISRSSIGQYGDDVPAIRRGLIVFSALSATRWEIVTIRENGTETTFLGEGHSPTWHPTEDKLLFIKNPEVPLASGGYIYEMDMKSSQVTQIYADPNFLCYSASYSPDGKRILFTKEATVRTKGTMTTRSITGSRSRRRISDESIKTHIFVMNADGTNVSPVSSGNAAVTSPSWGKNGEVFCLVGNANRPKEIYKLRIRD